jgi:MraZ protein
MDNKGRVSLPARFRDEISESGNDRVILTFALDPQYSHLDVYPFHRWVQFEEKLASQPLFDENIVQLKRLYVANAVECQIDNHGRVLIPASHRNYASIDNEVTWTGMTRIIELWQPEIWQQAQEDAISNIMAVKRGLAAFDL